MQKQTKSYRLLLPSFKQGNYKYILHAYGRILCVCLLLKQLFDHCANCTERPRIDVPSIFLCSKGLVTLQHDFTVALWWLTAGFYDLQ